MFEELIESKAVPVRNLRQTAISATIHLALIVTAVRVSQGAAASITDKLLPEVVYLREAPPPPPPKQPLPTATVQKVDLPRGFEVLAISLVVPTSIPLVDVNAPAFDARNYVGVGVAGGIPDGLIGATSVADVIGSGAYSPDQVDDPVQVIRQPEPNYPPALRAAGVTGTVTLEFIVGVDGRAESGSIKVMSSTNERFELSAIATILASSFAPARVRGVAVRQLVRQTLNFTLVP